MPFIAQVSILLPWKECFRRCQKAERMKVYYQHLNQVRIDMINNLKATQENLAKQREAISGQQKNHRDQLSTQKKQQQELQKRNKNVNLR